MCGLAGWFGSGVSPDAGHALAQRMLDQIAHRGPDGRGVACLPDATGFLGHVRLAIIDPEGGQQPMWSADERCAITFNGEIYNYQSLRDELVRDGAALRTHSDTEVVLELLRREGASALGKLRGMFALAFWNGDSGVGLLARDALGIKPLFLRRDSQCLWFASEAKAFFAIPGWRPELDAAQLHLLLNMRYPAGGSGLLRGVSQLAPGTYLEWTSGRQHVRQFDVQTPCPVAATDLHDAIFDAVRAHLVADVPVACYLSGGLDSGIITHAAAKLAEQRITSFTMNVGDDPAELANARETARWLGIDHFAGDLAPVGTEILDWLLWHLEVPKINALQSAAVAQLAAGQSKVCLSGLGGDELFLGYRAHAHLARWSQAGRLLGPLARPVGRIAAGLLARHHGGFGEAGRAASMLAHARQPAYAYGLLRNVWDGSLPRESIYGPRMLDQPLPDAQAWIAERWPEELDPVAAMATFEWRNKMVDDLLWQEDRVSMGVGLEVRVPFVDSWLVAAAGWPPQDRPGRKNRLRAAFANTLPAHLLNRPKSGFQLDIAANLDHLFGPILADWLSPERVHRHGLFNPSFVTRLLALERRRAHRWHFFMLLLMALSHRWLELFEQAAAPPRHAPPIARVLP
ncbi:MAG: asparagine synthase (glutamine-hydrolyzing) [Thermomonas sp.]|uniref:asparagine synthase (glutamine-hydrolyzing) n=1 Tax=Thermomonas sp. TaxID=1971895 RepID=UPI001D1D86D0|nr:asparagine synthase (glutamine-hydrolyzing) [Thermomonas sp.]MBZ0088498.1 asparagine synthase (glutamine-hydrolyzing) [Thermomonas sp.]